MYKVFLSLYPIREVDVGNKIWWMLLMIGLVAINNKNVIGNKNKLPWNSSEDLKHFKRTTKDSVVIVGRKTWEGIKNLPDRVVIVLTRKNLKDIPIEYLHDDIYYVNTKEDACLMSVSFDIPVYVIGGLEIYRLFEEYIDKWIISKINNNLDGDTVFDLDLSNFTPIGGKVLRDGTVVTIKDKIV